MISPSSAIGRARSVSPAQLSQPRPRRSLWFSCGRGDAIGSARRNQSPIIAYLHLPQSGLEKLSPLTKTAPLCGVEGALH